MESEANLKAESQHIIKNFQEKKLIAEKTLINEIKTKKLTEIVV